jgi:hypothetical protein
MALSAASYFGTLDQTSNTNVYDYSPFFYRKSLPGGEIKLWPLLNKREDLRDNICRWYEDASLPMTVTSLSSGAGALTASAADVDLTLASGQQAAGFIRIGDILRDTTAGKRELVQVTDFTTDALTVTRAYGLASTDGNCETHAVSSVWKIVSHLQAEGSTISAGEAVNLTERTNYTSIIDQTVTMTRSQMRRVLQGGVGDPWAYQVSKALEKYERMMEETVFWSKNAARVSTPVYSSVAGVKDIIIDRAGSNYVTTAAAFSYEVFDDAIKGLWENGYDEGTPLVLLVPAAGKQYAAYIHESAARAPYDSFSTKGMKATHLVSTLGHEVPIVATNNLQSDEFMILNLDLITVRFVDTMLAYDIPLGEAGTDAAKRRFISEFSLEMHNADKAHWYQTGVTYTRPS